MTGLIYVAIIAVWAIVLVPAWLRRHDHMDPERSVDRFSRAMQTLASRPSILGIPMPGDEGQRDEGQQHVAQDEAPEVFRVTRPDLTAATARLGTVTAKVGGAATQAGGRVRRTSAAARRRAVLSVLLVGLLVVTGLVLVGVLMPIAVVAPVGLLGGFVVAARAQVARERVQRSSGQRRSVAPVKAQAPSTTRRAPAAAAGDTTWEARPTTLPTYVTAPPAAGFPRVIDTATPGAWTAAAMLERAQQEKLRAERMAAAKAEAIAKAKAEQAAAEARNRDEDFLAAEAAMWESRNRRRAVNE